MAIRISYLLLFSVLCLLYSCKKNNKSLPTITCDAFNDSVFTKWFPYTNNEVMVFKNSSSGVRDTISIASATLSASYTEYPINFTADSCISTAIIVSKEHVDTTGILKLDLYDYLTAIGIDSVTFYFYGWAFTCGAATDTGLNIKNLSPEIYSSSYSNYNFQGLVYNKVQVITTNDTIVTNHNIPWVYKVFIAQNTGIIGYETYPQNEVWVLQ